MNFITVFTALNPADAHLAASRLDAAGFHPNVKGETAALAMGGYAVGAGGILVEVPETESAEAKEFLDSPVTLDPPLE